MFNVQLGEIATFDCPCCGRRSETVHGYLFDESGDTSVYFAGYTPGHSEHAANMLLSLGGWGEGKNASDRTAVAMVVHFENKEVEFSFSSPESSPWYGEEFLGRMLDPAEVAQGERERYCNLAAVAIEKDPRISAYRDG